MRTREYKDATRVKCVHCRKRQAAHQWSVAVCANNRRRVWVAVCTPCDVAFNAHTLRWINHPKADELIAAYREA